VAIMSILLASSSYLYTELKNAMVYAFIYSK
jgi:hypothetical protein